VSSPQQPGLGRCGPSVTTHIHIRENPTCLLTCFASGRRGGPVQLYLKTTQLTTGIGARTRSRCAVDVIGGRSAGHSRPAATTRWWATRQGRSSHA
jgi:hypothetical protein